MDRGTGAVRDVLILTGWHRLSLYKRILCNIRLLLIRLIVGRCPVAANITVDGSIKIDSGHCKPGLVANCTIFGKRDLQEPFVTQGEDAQEQLEEKTVLSNAE